MKIKVDDENKKCISKICIGEMKNISIDSSGNMNPIDSQLAFGEATSETQEFLDETILKGGHK